MQLDDEGKEDNVDGEIICITVAVTIQCHVHVHAYDIDIMH